ncbi:MAG TPA: hypothetical protein VM684_05895, partial [Gaiellales bacterium]|nr:hypothetical protein [Gaiellales bacterium]
LGEVGIVMVTEVSRLSRLNSDWYQLLEICALAGTLIAEIGLGKAGLVLSLDASRLARNSRDWYQLLELCSMFGVVIGDGERLYDPSR